MHLIGISDGPIQSSSSSNSSFEESCLAYGYINACIDAGSSLSCKKKDAGSHHHEFLDGLVLGSWVSFFSWPTARLLFGLENLPMAASTTNARSVEATDFIRLYENRNKSTHIGAQKYNI